MRGKGILVDRMRPVSPPDSLPLAQFPYLLGAGVTVEYMETGLVPRLPTAVLATGLMLLASLSFACGMILDSVARGRRETKRLAYLSACRCTPVRRAGP